MWCEKERMRLASDIHDTVLQELLFLNRRIEDFRQEDNIKVVKHHLQNLDEDILDVVDLLRGICFELYPSFLLEFGLGRSLQDLVRKMQLRTNIKLGITLEEQFVTKSGLNKDSKLILYRITQELITNAIKHSNASLLTIQINRVGKDIKLEYKDNGIGMDIEQLYQNNSQTGLVSIKERLFNLKGNLHVRSEPNGGMHVEIRIPTISL